MHSLTRTPLIALGIVVALAMSAHAAPDPYSGLFADVDTATADAVLDFDFEVMPGQPATPTTMLLSQDDAAATVAADDTETEDGQDETEDGQDETEDGSDDGGAAGDGNPDTG